MNAIQVLDKNFVPFISKTEIEERIKVIANELNEDYKDKNPLFIVVLNGAFMFASDIFKLFETNASVSFVKLKSYEGTESTNQLQTILDIKEDIENRELIIVEDIVDTGFTLFHFIASLQQRKPSSITICSLLQKPDALKFPLEVKYVGFEIENKFVIGYGLDYDDFGRNIPSIYQLA